VGTAAKAQVAWTKSFTYGAHAVAQKRTILPTLRCCSLLPLHPIPALASLLRIEPFAAAPLQEFLGIATLGKIMEVETFAGVNDPMSPRAKRNECRAGEADECHAAEADDRHRDEDAAAAFVARWWRERALIGGDVKFSRHL
jgi:hypothetical protein